LVETVDVLDVTGIAELAKQMPGKAEWWVVAADFVDDEIAKLRAAVAGAIKNGAKYYYFIRPASESDFNSLKYDLFSQELNRVTLENGIHAIRLPEDADLWLHADYCVVNPTPVDKAIGFQYLRENGKPELGLRIHGRDLEHLISSLRAWKNQKERWVLPLTEPSDPTALNAK
jgi:hypothetical protein